MKPKLLPGVETAMTTGAIHVRARIRLLPTAEGGRAVPLGEGSYRPNHNFFGRDNLNMAAGLIDIAEDQRLCPGESADMAITFLDWPELRPEIVPGREWLIQEGAQVVGVGTVLEVLD